MSEIKVVKTFSTADGTFAFGTENQQLIIETIDRIISEKLNKINFD